MIKLKNIIKDIVGKQQIGQWGYHNTKIEHLPSIKKEGLKANKFKRKWIFFSSNMQNWPVYDLKKQIMLRFPWPKDFYGPEPTPFWTGGELGLPTPYEFLTKKTIKPDDIEVNVSKDKKPKWVNLSKLQI